MVLDFRDAFMSLALREEEIPFNACALGADIPLGRKPAFPGEPAKGRVIVWHVLGFGGRPNPLMFARAASFASRTAQALLRTTASDKRGCQLAAPGRLQTYVDDPVLSVSGPRAARSLAIDLVISWWLALGVPLAWNKGTRTTGEHRWIGALFEIRSSAAAPAHLRAQLGGSSAYVAVRPPDDFIESLFVSLAPLLPGSGRPFATKKETEEMLGKAGRLSYLVPSLRPCVGALWGGAAAAREQPRDHAGVSKSAFSRSFKSKVKVLDDLLVRSLMAVAEVTKPSNLNR